MQTGGGGNLRVLSPHHHAAQFGVYLDIPIGWDQNASLVGDAYRCTAPAKLAAQFPSRR